MNDPVAQLLQENGLIEPEQRPNSTGQFILTCFDCLKPRHLYVNANEGSDKYGLFKCHVCGTAGNLDTLRARFAPPTREQQLLKSAHEIFVRALIANPQAIEYLEQRGFEADDIRQFGYGYAGRDYISTLQSRGFTEEELIESGLLVEKEDQTKRPTFWNHLVIAYSRGAEIQNMQGRDLDPNAKVRYINLPGKPNTLYHAEALFKAGRVWLTEGAFKRDALAGHGENATAIQGTGQFQKHLADINACEDLWVVLDSDANNAGQDAAEKIAQQLRRCHVVTLPLQEGQEKIGVDDFLLEQGMEALYEAAARATLWINGEPQKSRHLGVIVENWVEKVKKHQGVLGLKLRHPRLMSMTDGIQRGGLYFVAGSPHMLKTTLMKSLALDVYRLNPECLVDIYSNDDSNYMMIAKMVSQVGGLDLSDVRKPSWAYRDDPRSMERFNVAANAIISMADRMMLVDRSYRILLDDMYEELCRWREANPDAERLVCIDGFSKTDFNRKDIGEASMQAIYRSSLMKRIAQEADVPLISTVEVPKLYGKRPQSWDLRDSGQLEFDADVILLCYSEAKVKPDTNLMVEFDGGIKYPILETNLAKDKLNGGSGLDLFAAVKDRSAFVELSDAVQARFISEIIDAQKDKKQARA